MTNLITEARELCAAATPGVWTVSGSKGQIIDSALSLNEHDMKSIVCDIWRDVEGNAAFIARSRTLIPELCDALEKAEEQNKQLMREVCNLACESVEREKTLAKLEAEVEHAITATRWIPVAERLPEKYQSVLAARQAYAPNKQHYVCEAWLNDFNWQNSCGTMENVTHWMQLPAPPEEGAEK